MKPTADSQISLNRRFDIHVSQDLLDRAYEKAISIFSDWSLTPPGVHSHLSIERNRCKFVLDIKRDVVPPIAFALRYFGDSFPTALVQKLRNKPQTSDTLFELLCLGFFAERNKVVYEPKLADGKVPDLLIELETGPSVYIECKSHSFLDTQYYEAFITVSSQVCNIFSNQPLTKAGVLEHLRMEVYLNSRPSSREIDLLRTAIPTITLDRVQAECRVTPNISIRAVPQAQPLRGGASLWSGRQIIGVEPSRVALKDSYVLAYSWPGLDRQRRQVQRALMKDARIQLRNIPAGSFGMICIQTVSAQRFLPDIHSLIDGDQFSRIPVVWVNPSLVAGTESRIVFRDGARHIVDSLVPRSEVRAS